MWFQEGSGKAMGIQVELRIVTFVNPAKKPGPAFNVVMGVGYFDGSDYFYRSNDDTVPTSYWTSAFVDVLQENSPRGFGIVGPTTLTDTGGNRRILTHDFVSRVHYEIFDSYYPISLAAWMMDDWGSTVYGNHHTCRLEHVTVNHTTLGQNDGKPRYSIDYRVKCLLVYEQFLADKAIRNWKRLHRLSFHHGTNRFIIQRNDSLTFKQFMDNPALHSFTPTQLLPPE